MPLDPALTDIKPAETPAPVLQRMRGEAKCVFRRRGGETVLEDLRQSGSFKVRFPGRSGGGAAEAVLINTAGGLTDGDRVVFDGAVGAGASAVFTTQACERAYASRGAAAAATVRLTVGDGGRLAWLPQETILFDGSSLRRSLDIEMAEDSSVLVQESVVFGRSARGETVRFGAFRDDWRIRCNGRLRHAEAFHIDGEISRLLGRNATLGGAVAMTSIVYFAPDAEGLVDTVRALLDDTEIDGVSAGVSAWQGKLVIRAVAADGFDLRRVVVPVLGVLNGGVPLPRVWSI